MFHLPIEKKEQTYENGLILRLNDTILGIVVDSIDKVLGIASEDLQPPHPIFGDINIKYISGVVENDGRLYIIIDVEKIFGKEEKTHTEPAALELKSEEPTLAAVPSAGLLRDEPDKDFITETLKIFKSFHVSDINKPWLENRFSEWKAIRRKTGGDLQIKSAEEADEFLADFFSPCTDRFWTEEYAGIFAELLNRIQVPGKLINLWDIGCGRGFESYSLAALLADKYPEHRIKIWANDKDLLAVSTAPNLVFGEGDIPEYLKPYTVKGKNGLSFQSSFKEKIFFEYHDILNANSLPELDFIVARDILSFLSVADQQKLLQEFYERLKPSGVLLLGKNETVTDFTVWEQAEHNGLAVFKKNSD
jgi:purine-binding chemotaxis protein CheW